jgi:hypothetical protein
MVVLMNSKFSVDHSNKISLKAVLEDLGDQMFEANKCPDTHPVYDQLRERLRKDRELLDALDAQDENANTEERSRSLDIN